MKRSFIHIIFILTLSSNAYAAPAIEEVDRIRIAEAYRIGEQLQDQIWDGWSKAPFGILFITDDYEFLIRHRKPNDDFTSIGYDKLLKSEVFVRPRKFQKNFLATFPAFGEPLIVVGKAENTSDKTSTRWVFVLLHEHFHQLQYSQPDYYSSVDALDLAGGDTTGMWQINYPFPYKDEKVAADFRKLTDRLLAAYEARTKADRESTFKDYVAARESFRSSLKPNDYKYASFQLWQEGIARYTQFKMAKLAGKKLKPSKAFRELPDFVPFNMEADRLRASTLKEMSELDLTKWERTVFYPFGAVEGLMLDQVQPNWRSEYFKEKFALETLYPNIVQR